MARGGALVDGLRAWLKAQTADLRIEMLCLPVTVVAALHLAAVALFPGGTNTVLDARATSALAYLSYFPAPDPLGLPEAGETTRFLLYKIYMQNGDAFEGTLPDPRVRPWLRYVRWANAGYLSAQPAAELHAAIATYIVGRLPEPPLRVEVFSARWVWDHNKFMFPWRGFNRDNALELHLLGTYNGLTRAWQAAAKGAAR
jgi:hypothetical protein